MLKKIFMLITLTSITIYSALADSKQSTPVGPGIIHHHEYREAGPWHLHVLEINLSNQWIYLETVKANDLLSGYERTSSMAARNDSDEHRVVGAINGDFYATGGIPVGAQVAQGILLKRPTTRSVVGITDVKNPFIDIVSFQGALITSDNSYVIHGVNESRDTDELIVYNPFFGATTNTNYWGTEVIAEYITTRPAVNDTIKLLIVEKDSVHAAGHGNNTIPSDGVVLSGHGLARDFLNENVFVGDTISVLLELPPVSGAIKELVGGTPRLIRNGIATVEWQNEGTGQAFATDRHPRTGVGISTDSTKMYFFTVDGRQSGFSVGMSLFELADYMLEWGVHQGVNLDGGGSTTMVVRGQIVNSPSDAGGERTVANALMAISSAPTGNLAILTLSEDEVYVLTETQVQFSATGYDQYYNPLTINPDSLVWSCDQTIGTIDDEGLFTAGSEQDSGHVYVAQGQVRDSALVHITGIASIELRPNPVILKVGEQQVIAAESKDTYGNIIELTAGDYSWSVTGEMGSISESGLFTATSPGDGFVIAEYRSIAGSTAVFVGVSTDIMLDDFSSVSNWSLSGVRVNLANCHLTTDTTITISPPSSGKLDYSLTTGGTSALYLDCSMVISGTPEAIGVYVYGDGKGHWLRGEFQDADNEKFLVNFTEASPGIDWTNSWYYLQVSLDDAIIHWGNPSAVLDFPITWKRIYLAETDDAKKDAGTLYFENFTAHFIDTDAEDKKNSIQVATYTLAQNYPNPFNPITKIYFGIPKPEHVKLDVYNTLGEQVTTLLNERMVQGQHSVSFDAHDLASGVYIYRLEAGDFFQTKKMVVIK